MQATLCSGLPVVAVDESHKHFCCQRCSQLLRDPVVVQPCAHTVCRQCHGKTHCLICNTASDGVEASIEMSRMVDEFAATLEATCSGCTWKGKYSDFAGHVATPKPAAAIVAPTPVAATPVATTPVAATPVPSNPTRMAAPAPIASDTLAMRQAAAVPTRAAPVAPVPSMPRPAVTQQLQQQVVYATTAAVPSQVAATPSYAYYTTTPGYATASYGYAAPAGYTTTAGGYATTAGYTMVPSGYTTATAAYAAHPYAQYGVVPYASSGAAMMPTATMVAPQPVAQQTYTMVQAPGTVAAAATQQAMQRPAPPALGAGGNGGAAPKVITATAPLDGPTQQRVATLHAKVANLGSHLPPSEVLRIVTDAVRQNPDDTRALEEVVDILLKIRNPPKRDAAPAPPPPPPPLSANAVPSQPGRPAPAAPPAAPAAAAPAAASEKPRELQVFWDLDNIPIPPDMNARVMYSEIIDFFVRQGVIAERTAAYTHVYFVDPTGDRPRRWATPQNKEALRSMGCVLVSCTTRKEDADRQMSSAMSQLIAFGALSPVLVISSDKDFTTCVQRLRKHGNDVYVVHDAPRRSEHEELLKFSATQCWRAQDVVRGWFNANREQWDDRFSSHNGGARFQPPRPASAQQPNESTSQSVLSLFPSAPASSSSAGSTISGGGSGDAISKLLRHFGDKSSPAPVKTSPSRIGTSTPPAETAAPSDPIARLLALQKQQQIVVATSVAPNAPSSSAAASSPSASPNEVTSSSTAVASKPPAPPAPAAPVRGPPPYAAKPVTSGTIDGAKAVVVDGALVFVKHLEVTDALDDLLDELGQPQSRGTKCLDPNCKKGRRCDKIHFKQLILSEGRSVPIWMLLSNAGMERKMRQQRGQEQQDGHAPRFCLQNPAGHDPSLTSEKDIDCQDLHDRYVTISGKSVAAFTLVYNNAVFNALRGNEDVRWCDGNHGPGTTASNCDRAHAQTALLNSKEVLSSRFFVPNAALRESILFDVSMKQCSGHPKRSPVSDHMNCPMAHPRRILNNKANEVNPWEFVQDAVLFACLEASRDIQREVPICEENHGPDIVCKRLHYVLPQSH